MPMHPSCIIQSVRVVLLVFLTFAAEVIAGQDATILYFLSRLRHCSYPLCIGFW